MKPHKRIFVAKIDAKWHPFRRGSRSLQNQEPAQRFLKELGGEVREHEAVRGFEFRHGAVKGVRTATGVIEADVVVSTVYSWTRALLHTAGLDLAVKCFVHQRYVTKPLPSPVKTPAVNANPYGIYFRPAAGGALLGGIENTDRDEYLVESLGFDQTQLTTPAHLKSELTDRISPMLPGLTNIEFEEEKIGLLTFSLDGEPLLGPLDEFPGLIVGLAFHSGGFAYNPGVGELLAEYVSDGRTTIDVTSWSPNRFSRAETTAYLAQTLRQRDLETARRRH